ncbi:MAG: hypothetical protein MK008_12975 [Bdellovibrionales bacterium]|nr:hypothetical protein [Bdellovibrionales bacterium]
MEKTKLRYGFKISHGLMDLKSLMLTLPNEDFVCLGDTARLPCEAKSPQTIQLKPHLSLTIS